MKLRIWCAGIIGAGALAACDSGDIYPDEGGDTGRRAEASFVFDNAAAFPTSEYYQIVFGAFAEGAAYPSTFRGIASATAGSGLVLSSVPDDAAYLGVSLLDKGKKLIYHFYTRPVDDAGGTISLPEQRIDLAAYGRVQAQLFTAKCIACHGGSNFTAAGLDLTDGHSHAALVGQPSTRHPAMQRAVAGDPTASFLLEVLTDRDALGTDHTEMVREDDISLVRTWIEDGCKP